MEGIIDLVVSNVLEVILVALSGVATIAMNHGRKWLKSRFNKGQLELFEKLATDVYKFVEKEYGDKLGKLGSEKFAIAEQFLQAQLKSHNLKYSTEDIKMMIEKTVKDQELFKFDTSLPSSDNTIEPTKEEKGLSALLGDIKAMGDTEDTNEEGFVFDNFEENVEESDIEHNHEEDQAVPDEEELEYSDGLDSNSDKETK